MSEYPTIRRLTDVLDARPRSFRYSDDALAVGAWTSRYGGDRGCTGAPVSFVRSTAPGLLTP